MILPGVIAVMAPIAFGFTFGAKFLGGILVGSILSGFFLGISMANAGGAWDNAKKYVERGEVVEKGKVKKKGSEWHAAVVVGDTVGDPFKDTSGPALNILSKLMSHLSLIISGSIGAEFESWETGVAIWIALLVVGVIAYMIQLYRKPVNARLTFKNLNWTVQGLDDPKIRLALQTNILEVLNKFGGNCGPDRFKLGEIYQLWNDVEVTFRIVSSGLTSDQKSIYTKILAQKSDVKSQLEAKQNFQISEIILADTERTHLEAAELVPSGEEVKDSDVIIHHPHEDKKQEKEHLLQKSS
jgi:hypothetical protein